MLAMTIAVPAKAMEPTMDIFIENPLEPIFHGATNLPDVAQRPSKMGSRWVDRIAVAEPGGQGERSLDVVPIDGQVATIRAKVKHLADHACQHKAYFRFDGLSPMRLMGGAMVDRLAKRDPRNLSTVEPA